MKWGSSLAGMNTVVMVATGLALTLSLSSCVSVTSRSEPEVTPSPTINEPTTSPAPDTVGEPLDQAIAVLGSAGYVVEYKDFSPDDRGVWSEKNWVVIEQDASDRSVLLTVKKDDELELITPSGLWAERARSKCRTQIAGPDVEWTHVGLWDDPKMVMESGDDWVRFSGPGLASVHNEWGDDEHGFSFACTVTGSGDRAEEITEFSRSDRPGADIRVTQ